MKPLQRIAAALAACLLAAASWTVTAAAPAQAFGNETFGCRIAPGTVTQWKKTCFNTVPAGTYYAGFNVLNTSGSGYTYSWSISGDYLYISSGCTSTASGCAVAMSGNRDGFVTVTVTYTQNGQSATKSATAIVLGMCGDYYC